MTELQNAAGSSVETWLQGILAGNAAEQIKAPVAATLAAIAQAKVREASGLFLSVVMRTQGRKPEAFKDALVTLFGQSDQDFELLVMPHNVDRQTLSKIEAIVESQAPSFRSRIRVLPVEGGGRSRPLNEAISAARGRYFAFFDDDDLVLGNWVDVFRRNSEEHPGRLIRVVAATQNMKMETWPAGVIGFRSTTWPNAEYLKTFEIERHLERNHTPFMSVAFPRELFILWGERFDEELDVCEDWDMILRGAFLLGVFSVNELTVIYRLWTDITSSYTEHDKSAWLQSEARVRAKLDGRPSILPEGATSSIIETMREEVQTLSSSGQTQLAAVLGSTSWKATAPLRWSIRKSREIAWRVLRR